ncbi:MAG TPA: hypothetical protein VMU04_10260 [Candidatus Acidoferrum sp.]|nr:hypothetical protein [Candidatus Acidoferrum sp.]
MNKLVQILEHMQKRPCMYFGRGGDQRSLDVVEAFIMGYRFGVEGGDKTLPFTHFTRWIAAHYRVLDGPKGGFTLIREHVGGDERLAFDEFFKLLPLYARDMAELGPDGIHAHYGQVMSQLPEET